MACMEGGENVKIERISAQAARIRKKIFILTYFLLQNTDYFMKYNA